MSKKTFIDKISLYVDAQEYTVAPLPYEHLPAGVRKGVFLDVSEIFSWEFIMSDQGKLVALESRFTDAFTRPLVSIKVGSRTHAVIDADGNKIFNEKNPEDAVRYAWRYLATELFRLRAQGKQYFCPFEDSHDALFRQYFDKIADLGVWNYQTDVVRWDRSCFWKGAYLKSFVVFPSPNGCGTRLFVDPEAFRDFVSHRDESCAGVLVDRTQGEVTSIYAGKDMANILRHLEENQRMQAVSIPLLVRGDTVEWLQPCPEFDCEIAARIDARLPWRDAVSRLLLTRVSSREEYLDQCGNAFSRSLLSLAQSDEAEEEDGPRP